MSRLYDLTIPRERVTHDSEWSAYWHDHVPAVADLAELFKLSERRIRELYKEGHLTRGGCLSRHVSEWHHYCQWLAKSRRGGRRPGR